MGAALFPGHGAVWGAARKNEASMPQGGGFFALCHEAYDFLGMIIDSAGGSSASDRMAFKVYALQRLHAANFRGVAANINSRQAIRTGPVVSPGCGLLPLGAARPKPVINTRGHGGITRPAIKITTTTNRNFAAARLTSGT